MPHGPERVGGFAGEMGERVEQCCGKWAGPSRSWPWMPAAMLVAGVLAIAFCWRPGPAEGNGTGRRAPAAGERRRFGRRDVAAECYPGTLRQNLLNRLGAIRGYCEVARWKNSGDGHVTRHMDAAMEACDEATFLVRKIARAGRDPEPPAAADYLN